MGGVLILCVFVCVCLGVGLSVVMIYFDNVIVMLMIILEVMSISWNKQYLFEECIEWCDVFVLGFGLG